MDAITRPDPVVVTDVFSAGDFKRLLGAMMALDKSTINQTGFGRYAVSHHGTPILAEYAEKALEKARSVFNSPTLKHTYTLFSHYMGDTANLFKHKDNNACTYTLDLCLYYNTNWGIFVEGKEYFLEPNQALAFYGNDQEHWRGEFPNKDTNAMGVIFFHYAEPDHWYFTKGEDYLEVASGRMTEEAWQELHPDVK